MPRTKQFDETEVLEKAMELFWKTGFKGTSMQNLVDYLGINRASLYDTYGGKEALFEKAFEHYRNKNTRRAKSILESEPTAKEGLKRLFAESVGQSAEDPEKKGCFVVNTTTELIPNDGHWADILNQNRRDFEELFYQHLKKGVQRGEIATEKDLRVISAYLYTLHNGLKVIAKVNPNRDQLLEIVETALQVLD